MKDLYDLLERGPDQTSPQTRDPSDPELRDLEKLWEASRFQPRHEPPSLEQSWQTLRERIHQPNNLTQAPSRARSRLTWLLAPAFAVALLAFVVMSQRNKAPVYQTDAGQTLTISLSEGSQVTLNAASRLHPSTVFGKENRDVSLNGEAYFNVSPGGIPFTIHTELALITVLGTSFNVYTRSDRLEVGVHTGQVTVTPKADGSQMITLAKGEMITLHPSDLTLEPKPLPLEGYPGWREGFLILDDTPLSEICREIERRHAININLPSETLGQKTFTGLLKDENPETLVASLCALIKRQYRQDHEGFYIE